MSKWGGSYKAWYVGIASEPRKRLFVDHGVVENGDAWIYEEAFSSADARSVERHFIDNLGTSGGPGGGDSASTFVYAYKMNYHTRQ